MTNTKKEIKEEKEMVKIQHIVLKWEFDKISSEKAILRIKKIIGENRKC